jgi:transposase
MFFPEVRVRVFLCGHPVDMRKSIDGLIALTRRALGWNCLSDSPTGSPMPAAAGPCAAILPAAICIPLKAI